MNLSRLFFTLSNCQLAVSRMQRKLARAEERERSLSGYKYRLADKTPADIPLTEEPIGKSIQLDLPSFSRGRVSYQCINGCSRNSSFRGAFYRGRSSRTPVANRRAPIRIGACNYDLTIRWRGKWIWFHRALPFNIHYTHTPSSSLSLIPLFPRVLPSSPLLSGFSHCWPTDFLRRRCFLRPAKLVSLIAATYYIIIPPRFIEFPSPLSSPPLPSLLNIFLLRHANNNRTIFLRATSPRLVPLGSDSLRFVSFRFLSLGVGNGMPGVPWEATVWRRRDRDFGAEGIFFSGEDRYRRLVVEIELRIPVEGFSV